MREIDWETKKLVTWIMRKQAYYCVIISATAHNAMAA